MVFLNCNPVQLKYHTFRVTTKIFLWIYCISVFLIHLTSYSPVLFIIFVGPWNSYHIIVIAFILTSINPEYHFCFQFKYLFTTFIACICTSVISTAFFIFASITIINEKPWELYNNIEMRTIVAALLVSIVIVIVNAIYSIYLLHYIKSGPQSTTMPTFPFNLYTYGGIGNHKKLEQFQRISNL